MKTTITYRQLLEILVSRLKLLSHDRKLPITWREMQVNTQRVWPLNRSWN